MGTPIYKKAIKVKAACRFFDNSKGRLLPPLIVAHCPALKQEILFRALEALDHVDLLHLKVRKHVDKDGEEHRQDRGVHVGRRRGLTSEHHQIDLR